MNPNDVRAMVLSAAAQVARAVVAGVVGANLAVGSQEAEINVAEVKWRLVVTYFTQSGFVRLHASPIVDPEHGVHPFFQLFLDPSAGNEDDGSFSINLPAAWLPALEPEQLATPVNGVVAT